MDISKAINILADSVYDLKEKGRYNSIQRRNHTVDFYGYEFPRWGCTSSKPAVIGMSISQDLIYYERFEFKLVIDNSTATNFNIEIEGIDMTPYFKQQFNGAWITGNGLWPGQYSNFDVLKACGYLSEADRNRILDPGYKTIKVTGNGNFDCTLVNYLKYSHVNR